MYKTSTVAVNTLPLPSVSVAPSSLTLCMFETALVVAGGALSYSWSTGDNGPAITVTANASSNYTVTGTNVQGCAASQVVTVTALSLPNIVVNPATPTICSKESIKLTASGADTYTWFPVSGNSSTVSVAPNATAVYSVSGTGSNNCVNVASVSVVVKTCIGIFENALSDHISVYPNPSNGLIQLKFEFEGEKQILVTNSIGSLIEERSTLQNEESINLSERAKGIYFVSINTTSGSAKYKIVIE